MEIITDENLAAYLQRPEIVDDPSALYIVDLANGLVSDVIGEDATVTTEIETITLNVAARGYTNPDGTSSMTKTFDDASKTWRWEGDAARNTARGVYLTDEERARLGVLSGQGSPASSIFVGTRFAVPEH